MKILHTGDIHLGELAGPVINGENARMQDTLRCMDFLATKAIEEQVDLVIVAGDLFHRSKLWADQMLKEILLAAGWLRRITLVDIPVVLLFGTHNHDNLRAFENIREMNIPGLTIITTPEIVSITTKAGPVQVAGLPGIDKHQLLTDEKYRDLSPEEANRVASELLGNIVLALGAQIDQSIPSILTAHYTVVGCQLDNGQHVFNQSDVVLPREALAASPFDLVCLGHIHRAQRVEHVGKPTFYCGALNGVTFNEENQTKGFWIHDLSAPGIDPDFIVTPYRIFVTWECFKDEKYDWPAMFADNPHEAVQLYIQEIEGCRNAIVRVHYKCDEETRKRLSHKAIEKALYDAGAFYVAEIKPVEIITTANMQEMAETGSPLDNLATYLEKEGTQEKDRVALLELARPLVEIVSANMPTGRLSGVFVPRRLEVQNYRSYREESFDFSWVNFATVNGPNGIGKSAFFMDAICDCLYEEPREGDLAGWISIDENARSGSISFEFSMGESVWRVIRTRSKSGKTTLALQELVEGDWVDRSATKKDETQKKIVSLLGMDAQTFRCCALIMQDAYGVFMEASKEERMQVLANILGLGVYEQLHKLAKEQVTEVNRELRAAKEKLAELDEKLKAKPQIEADLKQVTEELAKVAGEIKTKELELQAAESLAREMESYIARIADLQGQIENLASEINQKQQDIQNQQFKMVRTQKILEHEEQILEKAKEYETVKEQVSTLKAKQPILLKLQADATQLEADREELNKQIGDLTVQIFEIERLLASQVELEKATVEYRHALRESEQMDELKAKWDELQQKIEAVQAELNKAEADYRSREAALNAERKSLEEKAAMLENSGCIDPENASCRFLADAKEAEVRLANFEEKLQAELDRSVIEKLEKTLADLKQQQEDLGYDASRHNDLKEKIKDLRPKAEEAAKLASKAELLDNLRGQKKQVETRRTQVNKQLEEAQAEIQSLESELKDLPTLEERLPKLEQWAKAKEELPAAKQLVQTADEIIKSLEREIKTKEEQKQSLAQAVHELKIKTAGLVTTRAFVENLRGYIKSLQEKQNGLLTRKGALEAQLEALAKDAEERRRVAEEMEPLAKRVTYYQTLATAFSFDGIPFSIVRSVVPELSRMANEILGQMTGGKMSVELRTERILKSTNKEVNALEIWISSHQGTLPYKSLSGGQKVRVALAVAFALADLKASRVGIKIGMLFVDEPSFLDAEGIDAYCDALEVVAQRYSGMKVIAISHDPRMKARFPQQIDVEDHGDEGSKIRFVA